MKRAALRLLICGAILFFVSLAISFSTNWSTYSLPVNGHCSSEETSSVCRDLRRRAVRNQRIARVNIGIEIVSLSALAAGTILYFVNKLAVRKTTA